jgi:hypothetical protein
MGVDPKKWGASAWGLLHRAAMSSAPLAVKRSFFHAVGDVLPCEKCQENYRQHAAIVRFPRRSALVATWLATVHNRVNTTLGRSVRSLADAKAFWSARPVSEDDYRPFLNAIAQSDSWDATGLRSFLKALPQVAPHIAWASLSPSVPWTRATLKKWIRASLGSGSEPPSSVCHKACST